ncbi:hypothetical protein SKAU_G00414990 [Synaphobranchus kaupii]|uniref:Uncharacterized protein n=1 Tax=Synaphobranchus kaupii TaxID=118154 RepID=A0A9Q1E777_SYNKA|nr:hypothetical protein SKAU_G00414990 [Synaphobranchus kaupii]
MTVTAHHTTLEWELRSPVLQTCNLYKSHTGTNLAQVLRDAVAEWKLERPNTNIPITTDNAKNQDYLHQSTALDPRFKSLFHLDPALRQRTYSDLTTEIVGAEEGQATEPTGADSEASPPQKKSAMKELFGETFASTDTDKTFANTIKEEVASYKAASRIPVDGDPLAWWKTNEAKYPHHDD